MLDFFHLLDNPKCNVKYYTSSTGDWFSWQKPRGSTFTYIMAAGGAGSGGCGWANVAGGGGGGGGASGSVSVNLFPSIFLPDTLYISCGIGGRLPAQASITTPTAGANGGITFVATSPDSSTYRKLQTIVVTSYGAGGNVGSLTTGGAGG
jgi:hypothetical protein